jgi:quinol monooxygenase YgiN
MSDQVVYVDRFTVREGRLEDFRRYASEMTELVKVKEPETKSFNYYIDDEGREGTAVFVFANADAADFHLGVASDKFQEGAELLSSTDIELLGPASDRAAQMAKAFGANIKTGSLAGFAR